MQQPLLCIRGLTIQGRSKNGCTEILRGVDLDLDKGKILGLVGESGSGKSTLGLAAMGYTREGCRIVAGSIKFDGVDLVNAGEQHCQAVRGARVAYVAQSAAASFNPARRLFDQSIEGPVERGQVNRREGVRRLIELYTRLQLPDPRQLGRRYPHLVSGGQLQRAMTAMALVADPELIVFDEPTTALDVTTQIDVLSAIRRVVESSGIAAIYISHDLALVAQLADRIMVMRAGRVVEEAATRELLVAPREAYTRSIWTANDFRAAVKAIPTAESIPLVRVTSVSASYGRSRVLSNVTLAIQPGQTLAVVGESGSGKSTLAKAVAGLISIAGALDFSGVSLPLNYRRRTRDQLRQIQYIAQSAATSLNPRQRVRTAIGRSLDFYHGLRGAVRERRVRELLTELELNPDEYADRFPSELSGGQQQRVCIARAVAAEPALIICDEVTSGLDQIVAQSTLKLLDRLQRERGIAYLFITHDLAVVRAIADEIVVMNGGCVVRSGRRDDVLTPPFDAYTESLLSSVPEMDPQWLDRVLEHRQRVQ